ncbi:BLUF domain-containing protein [Acinetobacter equi]|uniref:BLUF domain-containing protein n=1 Tax=Acinetobacter equi TaxID=1324350 RepID=A0A0N7GY10_9GAMM|nr:BLUF domain-containing protein [Acinetobacter equi]ALH96211.1 hypothetical protein AOY20_12070 [Acinetobacter equi]
MLIRLCYSSKYKQGQFTLVEDIRDILVVARRFNQQHHICGVLYYADGSFFQCLEGENNTVRDLYDSILKDNRHQNVTLLKIDQIKSIKFENWTMKYVESSNPIKSFFKKLNFGSFVPEQLDFKQLDQTLDLLYTEREQLFYSDLSDKNRIFSHYF